MMLSSNRKKIQSLLEPAYSNTDSIMDVFGVSGRSVSDSHLLDGFVLVANGYDGLTLDNVKVMLFHGSFQVDRSVSKFNIVVESSSMINTLRKSEEEEYQRWVKVLVDGKVGCVFVTGK